MLPQTSSTRCRVDVIAPNGSRATFRSQDAEAALLSVETQKDLGEACGSFTLHFAPGTDKEGRRWDQVIPKRSLVFIDMERPGASGMPEVKPTVMVGLTDDHSMQETYSEARPQRRVQIHGREISCVIVDATLLFDMALLNHPEVSTLTLQSLEGALQQVALTYNPKLARPMEDPRDTIERLLDVFLFVGGAALGVPADMPNIQHPVISLDLPDITLAELLQKNRAVWTLFEEGVTIPVIQMPAASGSLWNFLHLFIDRHFQEFFTRVEDGVCKIHFRGKPFQHRKILSGTRFKVTETEREPTLQTLTLDPADLLSIAVRSQTTNVLNYFKVTPRGVQDLYEIPSYATRILPQIITDASHPSFVGRYGLRPLKDESMYLASFQATGAGLSTATPQPLTPAPAGTPIYADMANQIAAVHGIPPEQRPWFVALIHQESSFSPNAINKNSDGSVDEGIAQFHKPYPAGVTLLDPFDPVQGLGAAAQYWNILRGYAWIGNDPVKIVAAYNGGPEGTRTGFSPAVQRHVAGVTAKVPAYAKYAGTATLPPPAPLSPTPAASPSGGDIGEMVATAQRWSAILRNWYDAGGELFGGFLTVRGHPAWNIAHRLLSWDQRGEWEAYIEGVNHRMDLRTGQYLTQLRITRGWYLSATIAQQMREEGRTQIASTQGGPPEIDPTTGPPEKEVIATFPDFPDLVVPAKE